MSGLQPGQWALICFAVSACADTGTSASGDSDADALPLLTLQEDLRIGSVDDPDYGFSAIGEVDVDDDGNVYVFEMQDRQIRAYDAAGNLLRTIGRRGNGPGEFQSGVRFGVQGDTVWTIGIGPAMRVSLFTRAGDHLMTSGNISGLQVDVPVGGHLAGGTVIPQRMLPDGSFSSELSSFFRPIDPPVSVNDTVRVPRVRFSPAGEILDTVGYDLHWTEPASPRPVERIEVGDQRVRVPRPPGDAPLRVMVEDGWIIVDRPVATSVDDASFAVTRIDLDRDTVFHREFRYRPVGYSDAALDTIAARGVPSVLPGMPLDFGGPPPAGGQRPENADEIARALRDAMSFPEHQPPIRSYWLSRNDMLWLAREDEGQPEITWIILRPDGSAIGRLPLPRESRPVWSNGETLWIRTTDEFAVPWLVKYRIGVPE